MKLIVAPGSSVSSPLPLLCTRSPSRSGPSLAASCPVLSLQSLPVLACLILPFRAPRPARRAPPSRLSSPALPPHYPPPAHPPPPHPPRQKIPPHLPPLPPAPPRRMLSNVSR